MDIALDFILGQIPDSEYPVLVTADTLWTAQPGIHSNKHGSECATLVAAAHHAHHQRAVEKEAAHVNGCFAEGGLLRTNSGSRYHAQAQSLMHDGCQ